MQNRNKDILIIHSVFLSFPIICQYVTDTQKKLPQSVVCQHLFDKISFCISLVVHQSINYMVLLATTNW
jgi:hypothetical protein